MTTLIQAAGLAVTDQPAQASFGIVGTVTTQAVAGNKDHVTLVWEVIDPASGAVVGTVRQQNIVPSGLLEAPWGGLAFAVAQAALEGIGDILTGQDQQP